MTVDQSIVIALMTMKYNGDDCCHDRTIIKCIFIHVCTHYYLIMLTYWGASEMGVLVLGVVYVPIFQFEKLATVRQSTQVCNIP